MYCLQYIDIDFDILILINQKIFNILLVLIFFKIFLVGKHLILENYKNIKYKFGQY